MRFGCISTAPLWKANKPQPSKQSWVSVEQGWPELFVQSSWALQHLHFFSFSKGFYSCLQRLNKGEIEFRRAVSQRCKVHMGANPTPLSWSFCVLQGWEGTALAVPSQCHWEQTGRTGALSMEEGQNAASGCCWAPHPRILFITHPKKCDFLACHS